MREDLFWGLVWVSKVVVLVCTLVSLCPVTSVGVLFRSINSVLLLRGFGVRHCCYLLRGARRVAFHGGFVVGVFYDCVDWSFLLARVPALLGVQGEVWRSIQCVCSVEGLGDRHSKIEFVQMVQAAEAERELRLTQNKSKVWFELVTIPRNRRALVYGIVMITLGQLTGINAVMYYLSTLMGRIGFSTKNSVFMSLVGGGSLLIGTIPAILYMDKFGRRVGVQPCWVLRWVGVGWCWILD